jgi:phosphoserine phosphatase
MRHVLSLIAAPAKSPLTEADVKQARRCLAEAGADAGAADWLADGEACEFAFAGADPDRAVQQARDRLAGRALDVNVVPAEGRRKALLLADMDSTLIEQECIDELAAEVGRGAEVAAITRRAMRGDVAFEPALRERVRLFEGHPAELATTVLATRITLRPSAAALVATMRASGAYTALVSGGFTVFAESIGRALGFDEARANRLLVEAGMFTGEVMSPVLGADSKESVLEELSARLRLSLSETLAVGDGANDVAMIRRAGLGVAFRAKPKLKAEADAVIEHGDLCALLFLQGYRRRQFVSRPPPTDLAQVY